jgi:tRNA A-37 threonylcarbamoyl transferase component Bud32
MHIAGSGKLVAAGLVGNDSKTENGKGISEALVIVQDINPKFMSYIKNFGDKTVIFTVVDQRVFQSDVSRGLLGEALAGKLVFPYTAIFGEVYLRGKEALLKRRLALESLENLVISYPELVYQLKIKPEFFLYEVMLNRTRVFPLLSYELSGFFGNGRLLEEAAALESYISALKQLETEGKICFSNGYVTVSKGFIVNVEKAEKTGAFLAVMSRNSRNAQRRLFSSLFGVFPQLLGAISKRSEAFLRSRGAWRLLPLENDFCFVDPQEFLFAPTSEGQVSLAERADIKGIIKEMFFENNVNNLAVKKVGGVLNDVYMINANVDGENKRFFVKLFKDWSGFKWYPLNLWSMGARVFAVSARQRLAKEYASSEFLRRHGFRVPKILRISNAQRLVFMEFVEGENLSLAIKRFGTIKLGQSSEKFELEKLQLAGEIMAKVHLAGMSLGDSKPENMIVEGNGAICMLDFEQANLDGDKSWDIAEFLYFAGHFLLPVDCAAKAEALSKAFIEGYLKGGGSAKDVKKVSLPKYRRVFSVFTMPAVIAAIANVCDKTN